MPSITAKITPEQRNGIYGLVRNRLAGIGDVWIAMEKAGDYSSAERLGLEFGEELRLLRDIGWKPNDYRREFALTMPVHDLMELLSRLQGEAESVLVGSADERKAREEEAKVTECFQLGYEACEEVLAEIDPRTGDPA